MAEEFTMMIKEILDRAGLAISAEQIEAGLRKPGNELPDKDPGLEKGIRKIEAEHKEKGEPTDEDYSWKRTGEFLSMSGQVELEYNGRVRKKYQGNAVLFIKPDDSLVVHGMKGIKPVSYVARADDIQFRSKDRKLTVTAIAGNDRLVVTFLKMNTFELLIKKEQLREEKSHNNTPTNENTALTDEEKALEARLRKLRIDLAGRDGISFLPAVYDNKTMRQLVRRRPKTLEDLKQVKGFGAKRIERYAESVLKIINGDTENLASA